MRWKKIFGIIVLLTIACGAALFVLVVRNDYIFLKGQVTQRIAATTGRQVDLGDEADFKPGFTPTLVLTNVTLTNASWGSQPQMITIGRVQVSLRLLPLLFKTLEIKHIGITDTDVLLETGSEGQSNWKLSSATPSANWLNFLLPDEVELDSLTVENLRLTFRESEPAVDKQFRVAQLNVKNQGPGDTLSLNLKADYIGQAVALSGDVGVLRQVIEHQRFPVALVGKIAGTSVKINGGIADVPHLSGLDIKLEGKGKDLAAIGEILAEKFPVTDTFEFKGRLIGSAGALTLQEAEGSASRNNLNITVNGGVKDLLSLEGMDLQSKLTGASFAEFGDIIGEKLPATDKFEIQGQLTGSTNALSFQKARGRASLGSLALAFSGGITRLLALEGINIRMDASGRELSEIGPLVGASLPSLGAFNIGGQLTGSAKTLAMNPLSAMVDKSDFTGSAKIEFRKRPKITLRLDSTVFDFKPFLAGKKEDKPVTGANTRGQRRLFSDAHLPLEFLNSVDADVVFKANNIHIKDAHFQSGHFELQLVDNQLDLDIHKATYKKADISGKFSLAPGSPPRTSAKFLVQHFDLGGFLKETGLNDEVRSVIDIAADLSGRGDSVRSLMAELNGSIGAVMGEGYLTKYLDLISVDLSQKVIPFWGIHKEARQINCGVIQFDIEKGMAISRAFVFDSAIAILNARGKIDLGTEKVDFLLIPKPKRPSLTDLTTNLRVSGTLMAPKVRPDAMSLATKGAKLLSTLVIGPVGLLAPFVNLGAHQKHPCEIRGIEQPAAEVEPDRDN